MKFKQNTRETSAITHFAGQEFFELFDGFGDGERIEKRMSTGHRAHGHVAHSHIICTMVRRRENERKSKRIWIARRRRNAALCMKLRENY